MHFKNTLFQEPQGGANIPLMALLLGLLLAAVVISGFITQNITTDILVEMVPLPLIFILFGAAELVPRNRIKTAAALRLGSFCCILVVGLLVLRDVFV